MQQHLINIIIKSIQNKVIFFAYGIFLIIANTLLAQDINQDSLAISRNNSSAYDSIKVNLKSPCTAMICSLIFPGMGQAYNGKDLKALVFFCAEFGLLTNSIYLNQKYKKSSDPLFKEFYLNNRNLSTWWLVGVVLFSMLDAYVDAHLYNFDESPDLSIYFKPSDRNQGILLSWAVAF